MIAISQISLTARNVAGPQGPIRLAHSLLVVLAMCFAVPTALASELTTGSVINCGLMAGPDSSAKFDTCLSRMKAGSIIDARSLSGTITVTHSLVLNTAGTVLLLPARSTVLLADGVAIDIAASYIHIEGIDQTTVLALGTGSAIRVGSAGAPVFGWEISRMAIQPAPGRHTATAIFLNNGREGILDFVKVSGFWGAAIDVGDNCWSNRFIENHIVENDIGFNFHGDNLNAWNVRGGIVASNRIGMNFDLGNGKLQGFSISDGVQMEANKNAAIRLQSGVMLGIFLSDVYCELFKTQRLVAVNPSGSPLRLSLLSIVNAYVFSDDTPPVTITTRQIDNANVNVSNLLLRHSHHQMPVAEAFGANTSLTVYESMSVSAGNEFSSTLISNHGAHCATMHQAAAER